MAFMAKALAPFPKPSKLFSLFRYVKRSMALSPFTSDFFIWGKVVWYLRVQNS